MWSKIKFRSCINLFRIIILLFTLSFFTTSRVNSQTSEYELKAVALEKLSLFTEWPPHTFDNPKSDFIIGVFGHNPFGKTLEDIYSSHKIKNKNVKIIYINNINQLTQCHILFISKMKISELRKVLDYTKSKHILTIADSDGFAEAGCFINFYNYEGKLRFEINQAAIETAGFSVDYKLLRVSKIVNSVKK